MSTPQKIAIHTDRILGSLSRACKISAIGAMAYDKKIAKVKGTRIGLAKYSENEIAKPVSIMRQLLIIFKSLVSSTDIDMRLIQYVCHGIGTALELLFFAMIQIHCTFGRAKTLPFPGQ
jgi:hypothetical protein